jgi:hypothetical protein
VDQFAEAASEVTVDRDLGEVLKKIASEGGWGGDDEDYLAACSVEEYYEFFKGEQSDRLQAYVQRALRFGQSANATEKQKAIAEKATAALKRIAAESRINRLRVISMHGIDIDIDEEAITSDN